MALLPIVLYPDPLLKRPSRRIRQGEIADLDRLIADMFETMRTAPGVGLAAPQIGKNLRLFVALIGDGEEEFVERVFVNPSVIEREGFDFGEEGCLSFPNLYGMVERAQSIKLRFNDADFSEHTEDFEGFPARVIQHEIDHLDGILLNERAEELYEYVAEDEEDAEKDAVQEVRE